MKKILVSVASIIGLAVATTPAIATLVSETDKTVITHKSSFSQNWGTTDTTVPNFFFSDYFLQVGDERILGRIEMTSSGPFGWGGRFRDISSNGDVCEGEFFFKSFSDRDKKTARDLGLASWEVTNAAPQEGCRSIGQTFSTRLLAPPTRTSSGTAGTLVERDPMEPVNVRGGPSIDSHAHSYGLAGDRVWIHRQVGSWYEVRFQKGDVIGWVHHSRVISDDHEMNQW